MGSLADSFNRMTAALRQQRRQLAEQIAELEHRGRELAAWREQLVRSEKLASVGRLAAGVAHEIGNPLGAVLGYVEMLLHPGATAVPAEETRDYLQRIQQETTRIHRTIQELLTFARPPRAELEPVDLGRAADTALSLVAVQRRFREVTVARELPADLPTVAGNGSRIVQVLVNLLLNAADAMDGQGIVRLRTRREAEHLLLEITDGGPGVAEADRARVFDPFFTTKGPGEGTGLGLSTSQSIVEALGGSLDLAAAVAGEGATFVVRLPLWRERPLAAQDDAEA
jgi:signal transduction histidine kinase